MRKIRRPEQNLNGENARWSRKDVWKVKYQNVPNGQVIGVSR